MATNIKGPAIFLAQFAGDKKPFNNLKSICEWAASLGYVGVQIPTWDPRCIDLQKAAESKTYCDDLKGIVNSAGLEITELSTHLQGQLVADEFIQTKIVDFNPLTVTDRFHIAFGEEDNDDEIEEMIATGGRSLGRNRQRGTNVFRTSRLP